VGKKLVHGGKNSGKHCRHPPHEGWCDRRFDIAEAMLRYFIRKAHCRTKTCKARIIIGVPSGITEVERKAVKEAAESAGARRWYFIEEPMAAAIGAGLPVTEPRGSMIVDIGGVQRRLRFSRIGGLSAAFQ